MLNKKLEKLLEELGSAAAKPVHDNSKPATHTPKIEMKDVYPSDEHHQSVEVEPVLVESPEILVSESGVRIELPVLFNERVKASLSEREEEIVSETIRIVYGALSGKLLNEEETVEVPKDAEAEVKVEEDKIVIEIPIESPAEAIDEPTAEKVNEALSVMDALLKEESVFDRDVDSEITINENSVSIKIPLSEIQHKETQLVESSIELFRELLEDTFFDLYENFENVFLQESEGTVTLPADPEVGVDVGEKDITITLKTVETDKELTNDDKKEIQESVNRLAEIFSFLNLNEEKGTVKKVLGASTAASATTAGLLKGKEIVDGAGNIIKAGWDGLTKAGAAATGGSSVLGTLMTKAGEGFAGASTAIGGAIEATKAAALGFVSSLTPGAAAAIMGTLGVTTAGALTALVGTKKGRALLAKGAAKLGIGKTGKFYRQKRKEMDQEDANKQSSYKRSILNSQKDLEEKKVQYKKNKKKIVIDPTELDTEVKSRKTTAKTALEKKIEDQVNNDSSISAADKTAEIARRKKGVDTILSANESSYKKEAREKLIKDKKAVASKDVTDLKNSIKKFKDDSKTDAEIAKKTKKYRKELAYLDAQELAKLKESEEYTEEQLKSLFEELNLDTEKYTFNYLVEQLGFKQVYPDSEHQQSVEVEPVLVESELGSAAAKPVHDTSKPATHTPKITMKDIYPSDEHQQSVEVEPVLVEDEEYTQEELLQLFEELGYDTKKYTFDYLAEQLGFESVYPKDKHFQEVDVKAVEVK
jgi:hypothetical protein